MTPMLAVIAVAVPLLAAAALAWPRTRRAALALAPWAAAPALLCALWPPPGIVELPQVLVGLRFGLDATGRIFLLAAALLWLAAGLAARAYHAHDARRHVLWAFWLLAQAGNLWLIVALDAAGFYAGFALMSFAGYGLVVHTRSAQALHAGRVYLTMAVLGEAALLAGLLARVGELGSATLPLPALPGTHDGWAVALLFIGFGVKAGAAGLHLWLPLAHPVAPTPASAVLSGVMIKAGVLGWLRFLPLGGQPWPELGAAVIALGLVGAFGAVAVGLTQRAPKTLLAYSSVSQMGFLTLAVGAALLEPAAWPALAAAIALYALHHGLAKGALFLGVAAIAADGRARRWALAALALPALALAGAPWTSGALAKEALKAALANLPAPWPAWLEVLLPAAAVGTTLLMVRFLLVMATDRPAARRGMAAPWLGAVAASAAVAWLVAPAPMQGAALAAVAVAIGIALGLAVAWIRPLGPEPESGPRLPAGDLLALLAPPLHAAWRALRTLAALSDRLPLAPSEPAAIAPAVAPIEGALRRFAVAGLLLLLILAAALLALAWR